MQHRIRGTLASCTKIRELIIGPFLALFTRMMLCQVGGSSMESFVIIGRISSEAVLEAKRMSSRSILNKLMIWLEEILLEARFFSLKLLLCFMQLKKLLAC
jgi:hypothetical protein